MDWIITDNTRIDLMMMPEDASVDMEIGTNTENDFQLTIPLASYDSLIKANGFLYVDGTEYGGQLADPETSTADKTISFTGDTWRGILERRYVEPPSGEDYLTLSGDLATCLQTLVGSVYGATFVCDTELTGVTVSNWQVDRYITILQAITDLLDDNDYRLDIKADGSGDKVICNLKAVPVVDYSADEEVSQDSGLDFTISKNTRMYNYMIAAGSGDLADRVIVKLKRTKKNKYSVVDSIPDGFNVRVYFYDEKSSSTVSALTKTAKEKFKELEETDSQEVTIDTESQDFEIGDIIGGRDYITNTSVAQPVTKKVIKYSDGKLSIDYQIGD